MKTKSKTKVHLVSFADGRFASRNASFIQEANEMNAFDEIRVFNASCLPGDFNSKHSQFMSLQKRGYGFWIWKPTIVAEVLSNVSKHDLVVYLDAGFTLNPLGRHRLLEYFEIALVEMAVKKGTRAAAKTSILAVKKGTT